MNSRIDKLKNQLKKVLEKDPKILVLIDRGEYKEALEALPINSRPILCELLKSLPEVNRDEIISLQDQFGIMWGAVTDAGRNGTTAEIGQGENNIYSILWTDNQGRKGGRQIGFKDLEEAETFISKSGLASARVSLMSSPTVRTYKWVQVMTPLGKVWITDQSYANVRNIVRTPLQEKERELRKLQATSRYLKKFTPERQIEIKNDDNREAVRKDFNNRLNKIKLNITATIIKKVLSKVPSDVANMNEDFLPYQDIMWLFCDNHCRIDFLFWYQSGRSDKYQIIRYIDLNDIVNQIFTSLKQEIIKEFNVDSCSFNIIKTENIISDNIKVLFDIITTPSFSDLIDDQVIEVSDVEAANIKTDWDNKVNSTNQQIEVIKQQIKRLKNSNP